MKWSEYGYWGALLFGIETMLPAVAAISFWRWRKERREEKMSGIAEEALNHLESSILKAKTWIEHASSFLVYSRHSPANISQYQLASKDEQENLQRMYREDPYEVGNYCRKFGVIIDEFLIAKHRAARLGNTILDQHFEKLTQMMRQLPERLFRQQHPSLPAKEQNELSAFLVAEVPRQIDEIVESIRQVLYKKLLLKQ